MQLISGKIPVRANLFFWFLILLIGWINTFNIAGMLIWAVIIFVSVLLHEYGHALTAVAFGQNARIDLVGMGGITERFGPKISLWKEFIIVFNGPLAGILLFLGAYLLRFSMGGQTTPIFAYALDVTIWVNLFWTIVNLLPIHPLDGGHLLRIFLEGLFGFRGIKIALFLSLLLSGIIALGFFSLGAVLIGALFLILAFENFRAWRSAMGLTIEDRSEKNQQIFQEAEQEYLAGDPETAIEKLKAVREKTHEGVIFMAATEYLAELLYDQEQYDECYEILKPLEHELSPQILQLLQQLMYRRKEWDQAISLGNRLFQLEPDYLTAKINSLSHANLGEIRPSLGWLQTAIDEGLPNLREVLQQSDYDQIRDTEEFQSMMHRA